MDPYELLGVERDATPAQIKLAYRRMAMKLHPDVVGIGACDEEFKQLVAAYDVLSDPDKRSVYDQTGNFEGAASWDRTVDDFLSQAMLEGMRRDADDITDFVVELVIKGKEKVGQELKVAADALKKLESGVARLFRQDGSDGQGDLVFSMIGSAVAEAKAIVDGHAMTLRMMDAAAVRVRKYGCRPKPPSEQRPPAVLWGQYATTGGWTVYGE